MSKTIFGEKHSALPWHGVVWGGALFLLSFVVFRFARITALDFESLFINLNEFHAISKDGLPAWRFAAKFGALPLAFLGLLFALYRLVQIRIDLPNPLMSLSGIFRFLIGLFAFTAYTAFCIPFAIALSIWVSVEAFAWIQWYDNVVPLMEHIQMSGPFLFGPAAVLIGLFIVRFALSKRSPSKNPKGFGSRLRKFLFGFGALTLLMVFLIPLLHAGRVVFVPGLSIVENTCNQCHVRSRPLYFIKTPAEWHRTLTRMRELEGAPITVEQGENVEQFLGGMRSFSDSWTFRTRCGRCHYKGAAGWDDRSAKDWASIVDRIARWSPYYYKPDTKAQIVDYLTQTKGAPGATLGYDSSDFKRWKNVGTVCSQCHSISRAKDRYSKADAETIEALVQRMNQKRASLLPADQCAAIAKTYAQLLSDSERFDHLFPHDLPLPEMGVPW